MIDLVQYNIARYVVFIIIIIIKSVSQDQKNTNVIVVDINMKYHEEVSHQAAEHYCKKSYGIIVMKKTLKKL